ncbi:unnamed protein product [Caenorhabditis brenneri]
MGQWFRHEKLLRFKSSSTKFTDCLQVSHVFPGAHRRRSQFGSQIMQNRQLHSEVVKTWNDTIDNAPFSCQCTTPLLKQLHTIHWMHPKTS